MMMQKSTFLARDGVRLAFDDYMPAASAHTCLIFLHGSTYNSRRYAAIGKALSAQGHRVVLLNWRGHGDSQGQPGDLAYVGQLEDDLADLIGHIKSQSDCAIMIGGHSAGSVVCLRYIQCYGCDQISALAIVSPAINGPLETVRYPQASSPWQYRLRYFRPAKAGQEAPESALQYAPALNMGAFWAAKLLPALRHRSILTFPANERMAKLEGRVLNYSYNLMLSCDIQDYPKAFNQVTVPVILMVGEEDEVGHPALLDTVFNWHLAPDLDKTLVKLPKLNHIRILSAIPQVLLPWLSERRSERPNESPVDSRKEKLDESRDKSQQTPLVNEVDYQGQEIAQGSELTKGKEIDSAIGMPTGQAEPRAQGASL